nr:MAG TPA: hypothetical protein [Caudoviricetes sp.]
MLNLLRDLTFKEILRIINLILLKKTFPLKQLLFSHWLVV